MGSVRKYLFKGDLPEREDHNSRLFIDLAENIHIHHREYRTVFSLDEYFEYVDIVCKSTQDVRNFLEQNPDYEERKYPSTIMIAGGKERQLKFLKNSPNPKTSAYYANDFAIELQDEFVTDEIHIHYRDFRIAMNRENFKVMAKGFVQALSELDDFENNHNYEREPHSDRIISSFNSENNDDIDTKVMGIKKVKLKEIKSKLYTDIEKEFKPNKESILALKEEYKNTGKFVPILLSTEKNRDNLIVDGHHRVYTALILKLDVIDCVVMDISYDNTINIRQAELLLKEFDAETNYKYAISSFMKSFLAYRFNKFYSNAYKRKMMRQSLWWRILRSIKRMVFGKRDVFKSFNEAHNHHNQV